MPCVKIVIIPTINSSKVYPSLPKQTRFRVDDNVGYIIWERTADTAVIRCTSKSMNLQTGTATTYFLDTDIGPHLSNERTTENVRKMDVRSFQR